MKPMVLTALGSENSFSTTGTSYYLVFNDGELRVPVSENAAEIIIAKIYNQQTEVESPVTSHAESHNVESNNDAEDDGVDQV